MLLMLVISLALDVFWNSGYVSQTGVSMPSNFGVCP